MGWMESKGRCSSPSFPSASLSSLPLASALPLTARAASKQKEIKESSGEGERRHDAFGQQWHLGWRPCALLLLTARPGRSIDGVAMRSPCHPGRSRAPKDRKWSQAALHQSQGRCRNDASISCCCCYLQRYSLLRGKRTAHSPVALLLEYRTSPVVKTEDSGRPAA